MPRLVYVVIAPAHELAARWEALAASQEVN